MIEMQLTFVKISIMNLNFNGKKENKGYAFNMNDGYITKLWM